MKQGPDYTIQSVVRVCDLLDALQSEEDGLGFPELVARVGMPKSSAFRYLSTLEARGYAEQNPVSGRFQIGKSLLMSGPSRVSHLVNAARPAMMAVRSATNETVNLGVLSGRQVFYALVIESELERRVAPQPGQLSPLHSTALGKALASRLDLDKAKALLVQPLAAITKWTTVDVDEWAAAVEQTRSDGYAVDDRENEPGVRCVAVPVPTSYGPAALSISGPVDRVTMELIPEFVKHLRACAEVVGADLPGGEVPG